jgi:ElaB/YqjD/DUF883 family membrane-anchored ribosome-binding protein
MKTETTFSPTDIGAEIASRAAERFATTARDAREELSTRIARLKVQARKQQKQARALMRSQVKKTTGYVRRNPLTGLGIAFTAGVLVCGLLFRR